jgi:hypothetical protein
MDQDIRARYRPPRQSHRPLQPSHRPHKPEAARPEPHTGQEAADKPALTSVNKLSFNPPQTTRHRPRKRSFFKFVLILMVLIGAAAAVKLWVYPKFSQPNPFPQEIRAEAPGISLFYPKLLPPGYQVDQTSIHISNGAVIYYVNNSSNRLVFTAQKIPPSFNFSSFYKRQLAESKHFSSPYGEAVIGKNDNRYLGSLNNQTTWLLLSTNSPSVSFDDMSLVMRNLKEY